jgi:hexosaminidase
MLLAAAPAVQAETPGGKASPDGPALVPWPKGVTAAEGEMQLTGDSRIVIGDKGLSRLAEVLSAELYLATGLRLPVVEGPARDGDIVLAVSRDLKGEAYRLAVAGRAQVAGCGYNAVALGTVTLLQALHTESGRTCLPRLTVEDRPYFAYCGAMLDVARKPHSLATLRECVRVCRYYKVRFLHLHLTDENAWVFPSTAFPRLGSNNFAWAGGGKPEVYDLAKLKELVAYADARGVTLVPEIEMPGHSGQLRGTLPEVFGYKDDAGKVVTPGVINLVREEAFQALDTLVGEVAAVFRSSPYVHIGCDEASVAEVEKLPEVRAFMTRHRLSSTGAVFNAFVNRMHGIVKKHGKRMIVWEGAALDPVAPPKDLIVMPWVGGAGTAAELVRRGYSVINPPWGTKTPYFDPYLVNGAQLKRGEPLLLGATSISWESPEEAAVPFLRYAGALRNEPAYNPGAGRGHADFLRRLQVTDALLDRLLCAFTFRADGALEPLVLMQPDAAFDGRVTLSLATALKAGRVHYTLDGSEPTVRSAPYTGPIQLRQTGTLKARWFGKDDEALFTFARTYRKLASVTHDAVGARVTFSPDQPGYAGPGPRGLTDGFLGEEAGPSGWVGWERGPEPIRVLLDLDRPKVIRGLGAHFLRAGGGIGLPKRVEFALSEDGRAYRHAVTITDKTGAGQRGWYTAAVEPLTARYVRMTVATPGGDWTFLDEVMVNPRPVEPTFKHAALGKPVTLASPPAGHYALPGVGGLTDGFVGQAPDCQNAQWLGIEGKDFDATIYLGRVVEVREAGAHFLQQVRYGISLPGLVDVLVSEDGKGFRKVATIKHEPDARPAFTQAMSATLSGVRGRFVRVVAHSNGQWLFADEVFVNPERHGEPE